MWSNVPRIKDFSVHVSFHNSSILISRRYLGRSRINSALRRDNNGAISRHVEQGNFLSAHVLYHVLSRSRGRRANGVNASTIRGSVVFLSELSFRRVTIRVPRVSFLRYPIESERRPFLPSLSRGSSGLVLLGSLASLRVRRFHGARSTKRGNFSSDLITLPFPFQRVSNDLRRVRLLCERVFQRVFTCLQQERRFNEVVLSVTINR